MLNVTRNADAEHEQTLAYLLAGPGAMGKHRDGEAEGCVGAEGRRLAFIHTYAPMEPNLINFGSITAGIIRARLRLERLFLIILARLLKRSPNPQLPERYFYQSLGFTQPSLFTEASPVPLPILRQPCTARRLRLHDYPI